MLSSVGIAAFLSLSTFGSSAAPGDEFGAPTVWEPTFSAGSPHSYVQRVYAALPPRPEYFLGPRWNGVQGSPTVVTWSFVPDGVVIPSLIGENGQLNALFVRMDALFTGQGGRATWVARIQDTFDRWEALTGIDFVRIQSGANDWDDGASWGSAGNSTRGDIRIAMKRLDDVDGILAIGAYPGNGDIVLDRFENWGQSNDLHRYLRNNFGKNLGHAIGMDLVCPDDGTKLMEPIVSAAIDGPQQDDIRGAQRHYGDPYEPDDGASRATNLGSPAIGVALTVGEVPPPLIGSADANSALLSIDADGENDWWKFTIAAPQFFDVTVTPVGSTYADGPQDGGGGCNASNPSVDALAQADLALQVLGAGGNSVLAEASGQIGGLPESLVDVGLNSAGTYYVRVYETNAPTHAQGYRITLLVKPCGIDSDGDSTPDCADGCPLDPTKIAPGACGCGVADVDSDGDGAADCNDGCPADPAKTTPGQCGCGALETDSDGDGVADCLDHCPSDPGKVFPGACGCGVPDVDSDGDGVLDCNDGCANDPFKIAPGICGCGISDVDSDGDGVADCNDGCPTDPLKTAPGICGCGVSDVDSDGDGVANCIDGCPSDPNKTAAGVCGCGVPDVDSDGDGTLDCFDLCPNDASKVLPGVCGCNVSDVDGDGDGTPDCNDGCPTDPLKTSPGTCGCNQPEGDSDSDGVPDCTDNCPQIANFGQADGDADDIGDACDNCVPHFNPGQEDCDGDLVGDVCEIRNGTSEDCDENGVPDNCEADCNANGQVDGCDILLGSSLDQNVNQIPDECEAPCPSIQNYCTGKSNSVGCVPAITSSGTPSASAASGFVISCVNVIPARNGLLFYGYAASYAPFQGGYLCVKPPFVRTAIQTSTGTSGCNGAYTFDFNAHIASGFDPNLIAGTNIFARWWMRDPPATFTTGFSNALTFTICD